MKGQYHRKIEVKSDSLLFKGLKVSLLVSSMLGNILEFYNFALYGAMAATIAIVFFPIENPFLSLLSSLGIFASGFLVGPLGALIFGYYGDQYGRKVSLTLSIALMAVPTFLISILPGYQSIGLMAPFLLGLCRLVQGLSAGGEYNGASIFVLESLKGKKLGFFSGLVSSGSLIGSLMATGFAAFLMRPGMPEGSWRFAFAIGSAIGGLGYFMRKRFHETLEYKEFREKTSVIVPSSTFSFLKDRSRVGKALLIGGIHGILSYIPLTFLNIYLSHFLNFGIDKSLYLTSVFLLSCFLFTPCMGILFDKIGSRRSLLVGCGLIILLSFPIFLLVQTGRWDALNLAEGLLGLLLASFMGIENAVLYKLFDVSVRYTATSFCFCMGVALGGLTPLILVFFTKMTNSPLVASFYLAFWGCVGFLVFYKNKEPAANTSENYAFL